MAPARFEAFSSGGAFYKEMGLFLKNSHWLMDRFDFSGGCPPARDLKSHGHEVSSLWCCLPAWLGSVTACGRALANKQTSKEGNY